MDIWISAYTPFLSQSNPTAFLHYRYSFVNPYEETFAKKGAISQSREASLQVKVEAGASSIPELSL